jgi:hypothetical protein
MARRRSTQTGELNTLAKRRTADNDAFRDGLRASAEQEARDTARRLENNDQFRAEQTKVALAEAKAIKK